MAVFLLNQCTFTKLPNVCNDQQNSTNGASPGNNQNPNETTSNICGLKFATLFELIQHIEDNHITDIDPGVGGGYQHQPTHQQLDHLPAHHHPAHMTQIINGGWLPTSCILRIFDSPHKPQKQQHPAAHQLIHKLQVPQHHLQAPMAGAIVQSQPQQVGMHSQQMMAVQQQSPVVPTIQQMPTTTIQQQPQQVMHPQQTIAVQQPSPVPVTMQQMPTATIQQQPQQVMHPQQMIGVQQQSPVPVTMQQMPTAGTIQQQPQQVMHPQQMIAIQQPSPVPVTMQQMPTAGTIQQQPQQVMHPQQMLGVQQQSPVPTTMQQIPATTIQQQPQPTPTTQQQPNQQSQVSTPATVGSTPPTTLPKPAKAYKCTDCSRTYKTLRGLKAHQSTHHSNSPQTGIKVLAVMPEGGDTPSGSPADVPSSQQSQKQQSTTQPQQIKQQQQKSSQPEQQPQSNLTPQ